MKPDILPMLRCPLDGSTLTLASRDQIERVNAAISKGTARDQLDQAVALPIDGGLVNAKGDRLYPIRDEIPILIVEDAIRIEP